MSLNFSYPLDLVVTLSIYFRASRNSRNFGSARAYSFLFIANLIQNAINQNDMRGKTKKNQAFRFSAINSMKYIPCCAQFYRFLVFSIIAKTLFRSQYDSVIFLFPSFCISNSYSPIMSLNPVT